MAVFSHAAITRTCRFPVFCGPGTTIRGGAGRRVHFTREKIGLSQRSFLRVSGMAITAATFSRRTKTCALANCRRGGENADFGVAVCNRSPTTAGRFAFIGGGAAPITAATGSGPSLIGTRHAVRGSAFSAGRCSPSAVLSAVSSCPSRSNI